MLVFYHLMLSGAEVLPHEIRVFVEHELCMLALPLVSYSFLNFLILVVHAIIECIIRLKCCLNSLVGLALAHLASVISVSI